MAVAIQSLNIAVVRAARGGRSKIEELLNLICIIKGILVA